MKLDFFKNFQEKDFDLTDDRKLIDWAGKQAYIPLANMMTSAAALEIDSCPIEGFDQAGINALLNKEGIFKSDEFTAAVMVAFGYRDESQRMSEKTRRPMDEVTKWVK
ncbi:NAD(P)H-dependent oxidoreductase [Aduncisulcus paluster]|uniref:NAD(P)H-dependent oxidoreductase n=1 Tax=Aduncisulcus paluster TaxID=2918883 RepID=A0ABQ5KU12_9EUKA|nr:NAD(P)H-dependent oxidoreductase [Aduncisulcus paluster]